MPGGFTPEDILEAGIYPGLGIKKLHDEGIDGSGVSVAVIDKPILAEHDEFAGRIEYIEVLKDESEAKGLHFHGMACASILVGKQCGVANKSSLYYFAVPDNGKNIINYAKALQKLLEINSQLPDNEKIKVVSISDGAWSGREDNASAELVNRIKEVEETGVSVVSCAYEFPVSFMPSGCSAAKDRDDPQNYDIGILVQENISPVGKNDLKSIFHGYSYSRVLSKQMLVPGDYRTTASNGGAGEYAYWGEGGQSWACPYLAGVIALGRQVNAGISVGELYGIVNETATITENGLRVINPVAFVERVRGFGKAR